MRQRDFVKKLEAELELSKKELDAAVDAVRRAEHALEIAKAAHDAKRDLIASLTKKPDKAQ